MSSPLTRRTFLRGLAGTTVTAAALTAMPEFLRLRGWYDVASAQEADVVLDTFNALAALCWPGDDRYSIAQGESTGREGALAADAGRHIKEALDIFVPAPDGGGVANDDTLPLSHAIASTINAQALSVDPVGNGLFPSPFARLRFEDKAEVWRRLEEDTQAIDSSAYPEPFNHSAGVIQFVFGVLPGFVQFFAFSEIDVWDPVKGRVTQRPVGWDHAGYLVGFGTTPPHGHDDLQGFYRGRRAADD